MEAGGADIIELGMPFTDPIADGPAIQYTNNVSFFRSHLSSSHASDLGDFMTPSDRNPERCELRRHLGVRPRCS